MKYNNFNDIAGSASNLSYAGGTVSSLVGKPLTRVAANGSRPMLVTQLAAYIGGRGGTRNVNFWAESGATAQTGFVAVPASEPTWRGYYGFPGNGLFTAGDGSQMRVGMDFSGLVNFGHNAGPGVYLDGSLSWPGRGLAGTYGYIEVPSQPVGPSSQALSFNTIQVWWGFPTDNGGAEVTGFLLQWTTDPTFNTGVAQRWINPVVGAAVSGLVPGLTYHFRVAATNVAAVSAGTVGPWSVTTSLMLDADAGDLDSWQPFGVLPSGLQPSTAEGLRRQPITQLDGSPIALTRENNIVTAPVTLTATSYGMKRTVTGLVVGKAYRLAATAAYYGASTEGKPNVYQLGVTGEGWANPVQLTTPLLPYAMPVFEFVADATTAELAVRLADDFTGTTGGEFERLAIWGLSLSEMPSFSAYRVQDTVYESSLVNHFDLASNSVGGRWWVDAKGVTQFSADLGDPGSLAVFTDDRAPGALEYIDIGTSYDTRNVVNDLAMNNHGAVLAEDGWAANDFSWNFKDLTSVATWGARSSSLEVSLYNEGAYEGSIEARAAQILATGSTPLLAVTWIKWNAQEAPDLASKLDIYSRVDIKFRGITQPSRIVNISHDMTPKRWIMTLQLERL